MCQFKRQGNVLPRCVLGREKWEEPLMLWNSLVHHLTQQDN